MFTAPGTIFSALEFPRGSDDCGMLYLPYKFLLYHGHMLTVVFFESVLAHLLQGTLLLLVDS